MPWANLDDQFPNHPKVIRLSNAAFRLHVSGICYCAKYRTDGRISAEVVPMLLPRYTRKVLDELAAGDRPLWVPVVGGYEIHDYLEWNRSKAEIQEHKERLRKVRSEAGRKGAQVRWQTP